MTERGAKLIGDFNDACFECGEWCGTESEEDYEPVYARQSVAEAALVAYIEGLEAALVHIAGADLQGSDVEHIAKLARGLQIAARRAIAKGVAP